MVGRACGAGQLAAANNGLKVAGNAMASGFVLSAAAHDIAADGRLQVALAAPREALQYLGLWAGSLYNPMFLQQAAS